MNRFHRNWREAVISIPATIKLTINNLNNSGLQIALIVDAQGTLLGTATDGDIRRALLHGHDLNSDISRVMNPNPMVVTQEMSPELVQRLMRANKIHQLPVVDDAQRVVGLHVWDEVFAPATRPNTMVIMAGGFGKRLRPFTEDCPKPMLPVAGRPMLEHIILRAQDEGFGKFIISLHYLGHVIKDYFKDGAKWGVEIQYLTEDMPLGTAGAIAQLDPPDDAPLVVTNGDVLTDIRYGEVVDFHLHHKADATMAVRKHEWQHPFGVVKTEGLRIIGFEEKPLHKTYVNAGIYALNPAVLSFLVKGEPCDMPSLFERVQQAGRHTIAYPMHEPWLDVGRVEDLARANDSY